jgi:hypothetical protein
MLFPLSSSKKEKTVSGITGRLRPLELRVEIFDRPLATPLACWQLWFLYNRSLVDGNRFLRNGGTFSKDTMRKILEILSMEENQWFDESACWAELTVLPLHG